MENEDKVHHTQIETNTEESEDQGEVNNENTHQKRHDEEEYQGIPIAGENEGDSDDSWENAISWESEEDSDLPHGALHLQ